MDTYVSCGVWRTSINNNWNFVTDEQKRGRMVSLDRNATLDWLQRTVAQYFGMDHTIVNVELSYLPTDLMKLGVAPVVITDKAQLDIFLGCAKKCSSLYLCVTFASTVDQTDSRANCTTSSTDEFVKPAEVMNRDFKSKGKGIQAEGDCVDDGLISETKEPASNNVRSSMLNSMKIGQIFKSKEVLQETLQISAMKFNFKYKVGRSDPSKWYVRCQNRLCSWGICASVLPGSTYFTITKFVDQHTCAPSKKTGFGKTPSAKTIGNLIKHKYEGVKEGPRPAEIMQFIRQEHGCDISYNHAWESREYAVAAVRGIPGQSYGKIPKYLHLLKEANPGTHTHYETDSDGDFKYLFLSFGQSIRGFYNAIRRVIVVDGTFLKSTYKGVLLVATAVDGNSNLYPIAFGVVDSENDSSWSWFLMQLKVVIADEEGLAFVSDRNSSIMKSIASVYPSAKHGICIHHLLNNVVTYFKRKGIPALIEKALKAYRLVDFQTTFSQICSMSPAIGTYLEEANPSTWARCLFPGLRFDIRTNNPAESVNAALKTARDYPVIPLLDSIREMLTRWFYERKNLSSKHKDPLTIDVENKVDRRIAKAQGFKVLPINQSRFEVKGDTYDCLVDLETRSCTCRKYDLGRIPCRHAIPAIYSQGKEVHRFTDEFYTTAAWRKAYEECINPVSVPEADWDVAVELEHDKVLPPETRRQAGRRRKRRHESVEDKIRRQGSEGPKMHKCSRCGHPGHNRATCDIPI